MWSIRALWGDTPSTVNERYYKPRTKHIIENYIRQVTVKKLHIGAQSNVLEGWLNVDLYTPLNSSVAFMDASMDFPLEDQTFEYVFSEHMIEHIQLHEADRMLKECYRVLKPGGKIRIATPGLDKLFKLDLTSLEGKQYFDEMVRPAYALHKIDIPLEQSFLINYITYNFGHRFIYSTESLTYLLKRNNFDIIGIYEPHRSDDPSFIGIEGHAARSHFLCDLETINIEASKP